MPSGGGVEVLQADLSTSDQLAVRRAADLDLPELLRTSLVDRGGDDGQAPDAVRAHEVGRVGDPNRLLPAVLDRLVRASRREGLDGRGVERAMNKPPRLMVALVGRDGAAYARRREPVEAQIEQRHQLALGGHTGQLADCAVSRTHRLASLVA